MTAPEKIDYKRELRNLYATGREPVMVDVPDLAFAMIDGHGDPNTTAEFAEAIEALYTVAYAAKFAVKRAPDGIDYGVMPLEGLFSTRDTSAFTMQDKSAWDWTLMIMQPDPVTPEVFDAAKVAASARKPLDAITGVRLERLTEGLAGQILHVGPYAEEGPTIQRLHDFIAERGLQRTGRHHEIYLSDPRRAAPEKLRTIVRQPTSPRDPRTIGG